MKPELEKQRDNFVAMQLPDDVGQYLTDIKFLHPFDYTSDVEFYGARDALVKALKDKWRVSWREDGVPIFTRIYFPPAQ